MTRTLAQKLLPLDLYCMDALTQKFMPGLFFSNLLLRDTR
jgi:hypothetical protein